MPNRFNKHQFFYAPSTIGGGGAANGRVLPIDTIKNQPSSGDNRMSSAQGSGLIIGLLVGPSFCVLPPPPMPSLGVWAWCEESPDLTYN